MTPGLTKKEIYERALQLRAEGKLFPPDNQHLHRVFLGSVDRFCDIAYRLQDCRRVLDVGAGNGLLLSLMKELGHDCFAMDCADATLAHPEVYQQGKRIEFRLCNVEVDPFPYPDEHFDAVVCCQVLEHFAHSHLPAALEMRRVLRPGGWVEIDVPNAVCFRNRSRMLRGKHITWEYKKCYLDAKPILYRNHSFFPNRHNREFTREDLQLLLETAGFVNIEVSFLKSRRHREGADRWKSLGTALKDAIPSLRKSLIAFAQKG